MAVFMDGAVIDKLRHNGVFCQVPHGAFFNGHRKGAVRF